MSDGMSDGTRVGGAVGAGVGAVYAIGAQDVDRCGVRSHTIGPVPAAHICSKPAVVLSVIVQPLISDVDTDLNRIHERLF